MWNDHNFLTQHQNKMYTIPFTSIDWNQVEKTEHTGTRGMAT